MSQRRRLHLRSPDNCEWVSYFTCCRLPQQRTHSQNSTIRRSQSSSFLQSRITASATKKQPERSSIDLPVTLVAQHRVSEIWRQTLKVANFIQVGSPRSTVLFRSPLPQDLTYPSLARVEETFETPTSGCHDLT